jgi:hypothetical protein
MIASSAPRAGFSHLEELEAESIYIRLDPARDGGLYCVLAFVADHTPVILSERKVM